jgi:diamine N-acetyltransferase
MIRPATRADIPTIRAIAHATWPIAYAETLSPAQLAYMLERMYSEPALNKQFDEGHRFLLMHGEATAIAFAGFEHHYQGRDHSRLHKLYALPSAQGTGVGKALLDAVIAAAHQAGDRVLELNVNRFNRAKEFYERQGFRIVRDEVIDIGQGYVMDDHVMERSV